MFTFKKIAVVSVAALTAALSISCSETTDEPEYKDLVINKFTLSYADKSYGDIDAGVSYKQADAIAKAGDIDVVAYYTDGAADEVKNPCVIAVDDIADNCGDPELYTIPAKYHKQLAEGKTTEDIKDFLADFGNDKIDTDNDVTEISISKGSAFLVFTTKEKFFVVVISNTGAKSVSLDFTGTGLQ